MINVNIKLFAGAREIAGTADLRLSFAEGTPAGAVLETLIERYPKFRDWKPYLRLAVNREYAAPDSVLHENDEVAVIPPVSGG